MILKLLDDDYLGSSMDTLQVCCRFKETSVKEKDGEPLEKSNFSFTLLGQVVPHRLTEALDLRVCARAMVAYIE